jgi:hypothetical protein
MQYINSPPIVAFSKTKLAMYRTYLYQKYRCEGSVGFKPTSILQII